MNNVCKLSEIKSQPLPRELTGFDELDYIYGYSRYSNYITWGMPQGKISLWAGSSGIGKSRLCIDVAKNCSKKGHRVLYILTEAELGDFASWAKDTAPYNTFYCSGAEKIENIINTIYQVRPHLVFIDSVNEIEDFIGNAKSVRRLIKGSNTEIGLRQVTKEVGCHTILLGQLNQDGKTIKGGTSLPHAVDVALDLVPWQKDSKSCFVVKVGVKHRHGKRDSKGMWYHKEDGVHCATNERLNDKVWCESHGLTPSTVLDRINKDLRIGEVSSVKKASFLSKILKGK